MAALATTSPVACRNRRRLMPFSCMTELLLLGDLATASERGEHSRKRPLDQTLLRRRMQGWKKIDKRRPECEGERVVAADQENPGAAGARGISRFVGRTRKRNRRMIPLSKRKPSRPLEAEPGDEG